MKSLKGLFIFCTGANRSILKRTPTEINKYVGIGATIFFTGVFAAIAAGFALYTVFESYYLVVPVALLWGLMIFNLDLFIVSTMKKKGGVLSRLRCCSSSINSCSLDSYSHCQTFRIENI